MTRLLLICMGLVACGERPRMVEIDPEINPYVAEFVIDANRFGRNIRISNLIVRFSPDRQGVSVGECRHGYTPTVTIARTYWDAVSVDARRALVYHELGHCVLHQEHRDDHTETLVPTSLMNTWVIEDYYLRPLWGRYVTELFTGRWE